MWFCGLDKLVRHLSRSQALEVSDRLKGQARHIYKYMHMSRLSRHSLAYLSNQLYGVLAIIAQN